MKCPSCGSQSLEPLDGFNHRCKKCWTVGGDAYFGKSFATPANDWLSTALVLYLLFGLFTGGFGFVLPFIGVFYLLNIVANWLGNSIIALNAWLMNICTTLYPLLFWWV